MKKKWIVAAVVVLALLALARRCGRGDAPGSGDALLTAAAFQGPMLVTVRGAGEIRAKDANKLIPQLKRSAAVEYIVPEGQAVEPGDVVARFNTDDVDRRINDAENALSAAEQSLLTAQAELEIQVMESATSLKLAEQALEAAQQEREKYQRGDGPLDVRNAELKVATTASKAERSRKRHAEIKDLLAEGFVTEDQVEEERIGAETAQVEMETAAVELELMNTYTRPLKAATVENAVTKAETELEKTRKQNAVKLRSREQGLLVATRNMERSRYDLDQVREERSALELKAPAAGVVTYGDPENAWRRGEIMVGANISPGQVLMTIPSMATMQAVINVPEADIHRVRREQPATVSVEAAPGRMFAGVVAKVAEVANPGGWMGTAVKEFRVEIALSDTTHLKPGFSCNAEIVTDAASEVLQVPVQTVFRDGEDYVVYRVAGGRTARAPVTIGRSSVTHVEILTGLSAGDFVALSLPPGEGREAKD